MKFKVEMITVCPTYWEEDNVRRYFGKFLTKDEMVTFKCSKVEEEVELEGL